MWLESDLSVALRYTDPLLPIVVVTASAGLVRSWRRGERPWLLLFSTVFLATISSPVLAAIFAKPLESTYAGHAFVDNGEAIVALAGACGRPALDRPFSPLAVDSYSRTYYAVKLYASGPSRTVLVTGSNCVASMAHILELEGVPRTNILKEDRAQNTHENAVYSSQILQSRGIHKITLVTDAESMLRADLCFRKQGMIVVPYLIGLRSLRLDLLEFVPSWQAIHSNSDTLHEMIGLLWYRLKGWI